MGKRDSGGKKTGLMVVDAVRQLAAEAHEQEAATATALILFPLSLPPLFLSLPPSIQ